MYAIVESGGKQYRAEKGSELLVDRLPDDEGAKVNLRAVMFRGDDVVTGKDLEKVKVEAKVAEHLRGPKIRVFKYRAKKGYRRRAGHRSELTRLEVTDMKLLQRKPAEKKEAKPPAAAKKPAAKKPAKTKPAATKTAAGSTAKKPAASKEADDGSQEGPRLQPKRPRLESEDARRQDLRRPGRQRRRDHRSPAGHPLPPRRRRRPRPRPHHLRHPRGHRSSSSPAAAAARSR